MKKHYIAEAIYILSFILVFLIAIAFSAAIIFICHFGHDTATDCFMYFLDNF